MKALVLAAGFGTRLGALTKTTPKCLVEIAPGMPMLEVVLQRIESLGVREIVVNTHYLADKVTDYLASRKSKATIHISHEPMILETGGGMLQAKKYLQGEDFIVHNGDIYSTFDLEGMVEEHRKSDALVTLATLPADSDRPLIVDHEGRLIGWRNKKTKEEVTTRALAVGETTAEKQFTGVSIYKDEIFKTLEGRGEVFSIVPVWLDAARAGQRVATAEMKGEWVDIGTPHELERARAIYQSLV
jgi:NDP-sugar pyrophosphorylase family protein